MVFSCLVIKVYGGAAVPNSLREAYAVTGQAVSLAKVETTVYRANKGSVQRICPMSASGLDEATVISLASITTPSSTSRYASVG